MFDLTASIGKPCIEVDGERTGILLGINAVKQTVRISLDPDENRDRVHVPIVDWGTTWKLATDEE